MNISILGMGLIILSFAFTNPALANCKKSDPKAEARLISAFQLNGRPTDWVSVKTRSNDDDFAIRVFKNRSFPVTVFATNRLSSSRIQVKRDSYDLKGAKICFKKKRILIVHPKGELLVARKGRALEDSVISLKENGGIFKLRLRPLKLFGSKKEVLIKR